MNGVSRNFGSLLRDARWTRWHKDQVYTAPTAFRTVGDWGFKQRMTSPYAYKRIEAKLPRSSSHDGAARAQRPRSSQAIDDFIASGHVGKVASMSQRQGMLRYVKVRNLAGTFNNQVRYKETERAVLFRQAWFDKSAHTAGFMESHHLRNYVPSPGAWAGKSSEFRRPPGSLGLPPRTVFDKATLKADVYGKADSSAQASAPCEPRGGLKIPGTETAPPLASVAPTPEKTNANTTRSEGTGKPDDSAAEPETAWSTAAYLLDKRLAVPNYHFLPEKDFDKFIQMIKKLRPKLISHLNTKQKEAVATALAQKLRTNALEAAKANPELQETLSKHELSWWLEQVPSLDEVNWTSPDLWNAARSTDRKEMMDVIVRHTEKKVYDSGAYSKALPYHLGRRDILHPTAGLAYAQPDEIFTNVLGEPVPGRVLPSKESAGPRGGLMSRLSSQRTSSLSVSSAGHIEQVPSAVKQMLLYWNLRRADNPYSEADFRVMSATMGRPLPGPSNKRSSNGYVPRNRHQLTSQLNRSTYIPKKMGIVLAKSRPVQEQAEQAANFPGTSFAVAGRIHRPGRPADLASLERLDANMDAKLGQGQSGGQQGGKDLSVSSARKMDLEEMIKGVNSVLRGRR